MTSNRNETIESVQDDGADEASESKFWSRDQLSEYYGISDSRCNEAVQRRQGPGRFDADDTDIRDDKHRRSQRIG